MEKAAVVSCCRVFLRITVVAGTSYVMCLSGAYDAFLVFCFNVIHAMECILPGFACKLTFLMRFKFPSLFREFF